MVADGGPDRPSGWAAGRVTHFLTQTLACMHEVHSGALRPLLEALKEHKLCANSTYVAHDHLGRAARRL